MTAPAPPTADPDLVAAPDHVPDQASPRVPSNPEDPLTRATLEAANVNPRTRLASDYLNHFNEIKMLIGLVCDMPECLTDVLSWTPRSYVAHFEQSNFNGRDIVIAAYKSADPSIRASLEVVVAELDHQIITGQNMLRPLKDQPALLKAAARSITLELRPLMAEARAIVNGESAQEPASQTDGADTVSALFA